MRSVGGFVLILLLAVVGLIWAVIWGPLRDSPLLPRQPAINAGQATPAPEKPAPETPPAKTRRGTAVPEAKVAVEPAQSVATPPEQPPVPSAPPAPPPKFPTAADVPVGTQMSRVLETFGQPVARTAGLDQNGQVEIFVYRRDVNSTTFILFRNGRAVSASTNLY